MARDLIWICLKALAAIVGAYAGYLAGFVASYYLGDHGDVGSAFIGMLFIIPAGVIIGALLGWFGARRIQRALQNRPLTKSN